jgi:hypothetical protein
MVSVLDPPDSHLNHTVVMPCLLAGSDAPAISDRVE